MDLCVWGRGQKGTACPASVNAMLLMPATQKNIWFPAAAM